MSGMSYAAARLAIDEYAENKKKQEYVDEIVDLWDEAIDDANDASLGAGVIGWLIGASTGDSTDAMLGWDLGSELGYHISWETGDANDIVDGVMSFEQDIGSIKFNRDDFVSTLEDMEEDMEDFVDSNRIASLFSIAGDIQRYGQTGGWDETTTSENDDAGWTPFKNIWDVAKESFGFTEGLTIPDEYGSEMEYISWIQGELNKGRKLEDILSSKQIEQLLGSSVRGRTIDDLFKSRKTNTYNK